MTPDHLRSHYVETLCALIARYKHVWAATTAVHRQLQERRDKTEEIRLKIRGRRVANRRDSRDYVGLF